MTTDTGTPEAYAAFVRANLPEVLREYADIAAAGGKPHWAVAMREAALHVTGERDAARELERDLSECRAALRDMVRLHDGKLKCLLGESDRKCLNRVTKETLVAARAILAKGEGK